MQLFSVDSLIVAASLLITLIIGLRAGTGIKDIKEYATANRMLGTGALVLTWLATDVAGETVLDMTGSVRTEGILQPLAVFGGWGIAILLQGLLFAPKFTHFHDCITMGDVIGKLYRGPSQVITGVLSFFTALCIAGMEITVLGLLGETLLGIDYRWGVGIGGSMLVLYTAHGGMKSVAFTDVFQFLVLLVVLPIITVTALDQAEGIKNVFSQVPSTQFRIFDHPKSGYYLALFLSLSVFQFSVIDPALIQRVLMGKTKQQLRSQFFIVSSVLFALMLTFSLLGLASIVLYPEATDTPIVLRIIRDILPPGIKGLAAAGIFAITMATFDSFLHAAGLTLVHDVIRPLYHKYGTFNELSWTRYVTVLAGLVTIAVGLTRADDLYNFVLISYKFTGPLLAFPLFAGVLGLKPDKHAFYIAAAVTIVVLLLADFLLSAEQAHLSPLISVVTNGVVFLGTHFIRNGGFVIVNHEEGSISLWKPQRKAFLVKLKELSPSPHNIVHYSQKQVAKYGAPYILLGIFCIVNYMLPLFLWGHDKVQSYDLMLYLRFIGAMACGLLVVKDKWPPSLLPYLPTFWHLTLLFCIPFTSTVMFLLTQGSVEWLINVAITIMFLILLVDWFTFFVLAGLGIALGIIFHRMAIGPINLQLDFTTGYLLVYQGVFATLIGLLFARRKERRTDREHNMLKAQDKASKISLLQVATEKHQALQALQGTGVQNLITIAKALQKLPVKEEATEQLHALGATLVPIAFQLQSINTKARDYLRLQIASVSIEQLLSNVQESLQATGLAHRLHYKPTTQYEALACDAECITTLLTQSIMNLQASTKAQHQEEHPLYLIGLEDTLLFYPAPDVEDGYVKKVKALRIVVTTADHLPALAPSYWADLTTSEATNGSETPQKLEQLAHQRIIRAHYGYAEVNTNTLLYVIPVDVKEVRPKEMDKSYMELGVTPVRANDRFKNNEVDAQQQEKEFFTAVAQRSNADLGVVKTALELIKWYHGPVERLLGEPFYLHPLAVAQIVLDYNTDEATIVGALLHDTLEDTSILLQHLESVFGKETTEIVDLVTHLQSVPGSFYKVKLSAEENIKMLERAGNTHGLYVKLADRMHNIRTIEGHDSLAKQKSIAQETLQFFVPLAERLALQGVAEELQERCRAVIAKNK